MRVIGIDPGTVCCGYGIVEVPISKSHPEQVGTNLRYITSGEIKMNKKDPLPMRLKLLYSSLKKIIDEYKPSHLCIEKIFYHKSISSAFTLGSTRGIAMLLAAENNLPVFEYNSTELKMAITGYGRAEKHQIKQMVTRILNLQYEQDSRIQGFKDSSERKMLKDSRIQALDSLTPQTLEPFVLTDDASDALALCICHINHHTGYKDIGDKGSSK